MSEGNNYEERKIEKAGIFLFTLGFDGGGVLQS